MYNAFICDAIRTPIGRYGGALAHVRTDDLGAIPLRALLERNAKVDWSAVDDVIYGCANQAGEDNRNVGRMALLLAGLPVEVPGTTVNRLCGSSMDAIAIAARAIKSGETSLMIAGGVESMSRADQDAFAWRSQHRAAAAIAAGRFNDEIVPVTLPAKKGDPIVVSRDEHPRETTVESLAKLKGIVRPDGTVTAGNASGVNDGACAMLIASEDACRSHGLTPRARILASAAAGVAPRIMGFGPAPATRRVLAKAGLTLADIDVIELNEAFAAQALAVTRDLGLADDAANVNPNGGAIALGHPLGASGARLVTTALYQLHRTGGRLALCTMCIGVGQGIAIIIERV